MRTASLSSNSTGLLLGPSQIAISTPKQSLVPNWSGSYHSLPDIAIESIVLYLDHPAEFAVSCRFVNLVCARPRLRLLWLLARPKWVANGKLERAVLEWLSGWRDTNNNPGPLSPSPKFPARLLSESLCRTMLLSVEGGLPNHCSLQSNPSIVRGVWAVACAKGYAYIVQTIVSTPTFRNQLLTEDWTNAYMAVVATNQIGILQLIHTTKPSDFPPTGSAGRLGRLVARFAARRSSINMLSLLASMGLLTRVDEGWGLPLVYAAKHNRWEVFTQIMLEYFFADPGSQDHPRIYGVTDGRQWGEAMGLAAQSGRDDLVDLMLWKGVHFYGYENLQAGFNSAMAAAVEHSLVEFAGTLLQELSACWGTENRNWFNILRDAACVQGDNAMHVFRSLIGSLGYDPLNPPSPSFASSYYSRSTNATLGQFADLHGFVMRHGQLSVPHKREVTLAVLEVVPGIRDAAVKCAVRLGDVAMVNMLLDENLSRDHCIAESSMAFLHDLEPARRRLYWQGLMQIALDSTEAKDVVGVAKLILEKAGNALGVWEVDGVDGMFDAMKALVDNTKYPDSESRHELLKLIVELSRGLKRPVDPRTPGDVTPPSTPKRGENVEGDEASPAEMRDVLDISARYVDLLFRFAKLPHVTNRSNNYETAGPSVDVLLSACEWIHEQKLKFQKGKSVDVLPTYLSESMETLADATLRFMWKGQFEAVTRLVNSGIDPLAASTRELEDMVQNLEHLMERERPGSMGDVEDLFALFKCVLTKRRSDAKAVSRSSSSEKEAALQSSVHGASPVVAALLNNPRRVAKLVVDIAMFRLYVDAIHKNSDPTVISTYSHVSSSSSVSAAHSGNPTEFRGMRNGLERVKAAVAERCLAQDGVLAGVLGGILVWDAVVAGDVEMVERLVGVGGDPRCAPAMTILWGIAMLTVPKPKVVWKDVTCDGCSKPDFTGLRYKCTVCHDFDFCEPCYETLSASHADCTHGFDVVESPTALWRGYHCDGCQVRVFPGPRYHCVVCDNFDLCERCYGRFSARPSGRRASVQPSTEAQSVGAAALSPALDAVMRHSRSHRFDRYDRVKCLREIFGSAPIEEPEVLEFVGALSTSFVGHGQYRVHPYEGSSLPSPSFIGAQAVLVAKRVRELTNVFRICSSSGSSGIVSAGAVQTQYGKVDVTRLDSSEILWYAVEGMLSAKSTLSDSPLAATALLRGVVAGESWLVRRLVEGGGARVGLWSCDETAWTRGLPRPMRVVLGNAMYTLWDVTRTHAPAKGQRMIGFVHGMLSASFAAAKRREAVWTPENECENRDGLALIPKPLLLSVSRLVRWSLMLPERGYAQPISVPVSTAYNHAHIYPASNNPSRHGHPRAQDVRALFRDCGDLSLDNEGLDKAFVASVLLRCAASGNVDGVERMLQWVGRSVIEDVRVDVGDASAEDVVWFLRRMVGVRRVVERERDVVPDLVRYLLSKKGSYSDGAAETEELKVQRVVCGELLFDAAIRGDTRMVRAFVDGLDTASASYDNRVPVVDRIAFLREQGAGGKLQRHLKAALNRKHFATAMVLVQHGFSLRGVGADTLRLLFDAAELAADSGNVLEQLVVSVRVTAACRALEEMVMWEDDDADGSRTIGAADEYSDARILPRLEAPESMWETLTSVYDHATDERVRESYRRSANHAPIASSSCARQLLLYSLESNMDDWESGLKPILVRSISKGYPAGMIRLVVETAMDRWRSKVPHELEDTLSSASDIFVMDGHSEDTIAELDMVDATGAEILSMPKVVDNDGNGAHVGAGGTPGWAVVVSDLCTMIGNLCSSSTGSSHETSVLRALVEPLAVCASEGDEDACQAVEGAVGWGWIKKCYGESVERANEPALQVLLRARAGSAHVQIRELAQTIARGFKVCKRGDPGAFGTNEMGFDGSFAWNLCRWATSLKVDSDMGMSEGELNSVAVSGLDDSALSPLSGPSTLVEMPAIFSEEVVFFSPTVGWDVIGVLRNGYEHLVEQRTVE